jgi:hypothetical protein
VIYKVFSFGFDFEATVDTEMSEKYIYQKEKDLRCGMLSSIFGMAIQSLLHMIRLVPFQEREETWNYADSSHNIVHVGCVDDNIRPMISMLCVGTVSLVSHCAGRCFHVPGCSSSRLSNESPNDISPARYSRQPLSFVREVLDMLKITYP